eukprot:TRINITY_DN27317_c0_g1_i2.p1 TRINITY_DN27317_c0_g1~~TRINITY_DN27317_c0_g1_i2.p1  ORF type:complete len:809 (-),score=175.98 TRINITY_DN27317_c0_g1_i2:159-2585(-)
MCIRDRYTHGFRILGQVFVRTAGVLLVGIALILVMLVVCSVFMWHTERRNPDPNMQRYYSSVPNSLWLSLLNLSGEAPLCDYSNLGMVMVGFMAIFGSALVGVPIGIIGSAFGDALDQDQAAQEVDQASEEEKQENVEMQTLIEVKNSAPGYGSIGTAVSERRAQLAKVFDVFDRDRSGILETTELLELGDLLGLTPRNTEQLLRMADKNRDGTVEKAEFCAAMDTWLSKDDQKFDEIIYSLLNRGARVEEEHRVSPNRVILENLVRGHGHRGRLFVIVSITCTLLSVVLDVLGTGSRYKAELNWAQGGLTVWFTFEFGIRAIAKGSDYLCSGIAMVDFLATFPWYVTHGFIGPSAAVAMHKYSAPLRSLRLLRLVRLDSYSPSISLIDDAVQRCSDGLSVAMSTWVIIWFGFSACLYLVEHDDVTNGEDKRFRSPASSLQYASVLLTGDYPIVDFNPWGRALCCVAVFVAVGICAVPASLFAESFVQILEEETQLQLSRRKSAATKLQSCFRGSVARREVRRKLENNTLFTRLVGDAKLHKAAGESTGLGASIQKWKSGNSDSSKLWRTGMRCLCFVNVVSVVLESVPEVEAMLPHSAWQTFETISVLLFTVDYILSALSAAYNPAYNFRTSNYATSFSGVMDLMSVVPLWCEMTVPLLGLHWHIDATVFRILRLNQLFGLDFFASQMVVMQQVLCKVGPVLRATMVLALIVWIGVATAFYYVELHIPENFGGEDPMVFSSILDALYYTGIFMAGEWAVVDFTPLGAVVCVFTAAVGVALFSIPVGILFEGFQETLMEKYRDPADEE